MVREVRMVEQLKTRRKQVSLAILVLVGLGMLLFLVGLGFNARSKHYKHIYSWLALYEPITIKQGNQVERVFRTRDATTYTIGLEFSTVNATGRFHAQLRDNLDVAFAIYDGDTLASAGNADESERVDTTNITIERVMGEWQAKKNSQYRLMLIVNETSDVLNLYQPALRIASKPNPVYFTKSFFYFRMARFTVLVGLLPIVVAFGLWFVLRFKLRPKEGK